MTVHKLHKEMLWIKQNGECFYCGEAMVKDCLTKRQPAKLATIDHYIPLSILTTGIKLLLIDNRINTNLVLACRMCNQSKASKIPEDWNGRVGPYKWVSNKWMRVGTAEHTISVVSDDVHVITVGC